MSAGAAAVIAALVVLLAAPGRPRGGAGVQRRGRSGRDAGARGHGGGPGLGSAATSARARLLAAAASGVGSALLVGGPAGVAAGALVASAVWVVVGRLEPSARRHRREALERQAPLVVDLVAACLASGATVDASVRAAARATGDPAASLLQQAVDAAALGSPVSDAWRRAAEEDPLAGLAHAIVRSVDTGAPLADVLPRLAARARSRRAARTEAHVRTAAVRLTGPLGLAFLPAFVLLGVVPVVAAWVGAVL